MLTVLGGLTAFVLIIVLSTLFNGYALTKLWSWFVVPAFGVAPLGLTQAIGVSLIVSYLTHQIHEEDKSRSTSETLIRSVAIAIMKPSLALLMGWIVTLFM